MNLPTFLQPTTPIDDRSLANEQVSFGSDALIALQGFKMQTQDQSEWCWAAIAASISTYFSPNSSWSQCRVASASLPGNLNCCVDPSTCNVQGRLDIALATTNNLANSQQGSVDRNAVQQEIQNDHPIGCHITWSGDGAEGHFVLIVGFDSITNDLEIADSLYPSYPPRSIPISSFAGAYMAGGTWDWTYRTQKPPFSPQAATSS